MKGIPMSFKKFSSMHSGPSKDSAADKSKQVSPTEKSGKQSGQEPDGAQPGSKS